MAESRWAFFSLERTLGTPHGNTWATPTDKPAAATPRDTKVAEPLIPNHIPHITFLVEQIWAWKPPDLIADSGSHPKKISNHIVVVYIGCPGPPGGPPGGPPRGLPRGHVVTFPIVYHPVLEAVDLQRLRRPLGVQEWNPFGKVRPESPQEDFLKPKLGLETPRCDCRFGFLTQKRFRTTSWLYI